MEYLNEHIALCGTSVKALDLSFLTSGVLDLDTTQPYELKTASGFSVAYEWDIISDRLKWHGEIHKALGYSCEEFPSTEKEWCNIIHPDDCECVQKFVYKHLKTDVLYLVKYRVQRKDGSYIYILDYGTALRNSCGTPYRLIGLTKLQENVIQ